MSINNPQTRLRWFQFRLRTLLVLVTLVSVGLGMGKWFYVIYFDPVMLLTPRGVVDRFQLLDFYFEKRVALVGIYQRYEQDSPYQVVWFGDTPIALLGNLPKSLPRDGETVYVVGRLSFILKNMKFTPLVTDRRNNDPYRYSTYQAVTVQRILAYGIDVERIGLKTEQND